MNELDELRARISAQAGELAALRDELAQVEAERDRLASELETVRASLKQYEEWQKANAR